MPSPISFDNIPIESMLLCFRFTGLVYLAITLSYRLCFFPSYNIFENHKSNAAAIFFDYTVDIIYLLIFIWEMQDARIPRVLDISLLSGARPAEGNIINTVPTVDSPGPGSGGDRMRLDQFEDNSSNSLLSVQKKRRRRLSWSHLLIEIISMVPWEVIGYASGMNGYYALRLLKLTRFKNYFFYWNEICQLSTIGTSSIFVYIRNPVLNRVLLLAITMAVLGHVTACLFYYFSLQQIKGGNEASWVYVDGLVDKDGELQTTVSLCYLRSLYWSIQTLDTVGFGDIVAYSEGETWFCILYFYISAYLVYYSIANLMTIITNLDASRTRSIILKANFTKYAAYRKLPTHLTQRVFSYYDYQWRQLKGLSEAKLMAELPANFAQSIHQHITRDFLMQLELFQGVNKSVMNVLGENSENYVYSPEDIIIDENSRVSGIYVILSGQVESLWPGLHEAELISTKDSFGVAALQKSYVSGRIYRSRAYSEIIFLRGSVFRIVCEKLLTPFELMDMQRRISDHATAPVPPMRKTVVLRRFSENVSALTEKERLNILIKRINLLLFHPDSTFRRIWTSFGFIFQLFYLTSTALLLALNLHQDFSSHSLPLLICNYIVDIYFLFDFIFRGLCFGYERGDGFVVLRKVEIFQRFLEKESIVLGILATFPFDLILGASIDWRIIPVFRLLKLLHLQYFYSNADDFVHALSLYCGIAISFEMQRFVTLYIMLFQLCHWVGCIWQLSANVSTAFFGYDINWMIRDRMGTITGVSYDTMAGVLYMRSIYWAINVMSSIGFPDIEVTNPVEMVTVILVMFFGYLAFNTLLGAIATLIGSFNRDKREFNNLVEKMRALAVQTALSEELESKIVRYYEYIWTHHQGINENELLKTLPKSLKSAVVNHVVGPLVTAIPFFATCSEQMQHLIIGMFEVAVFLDGDTLMVQGEVGKELFIIERGEVEVTNRDRSVVFAKLEAGSYIGESCILEIAPRSASVFALGYVDTFFLTLDNFLKATEKFPTEYQDIIEGIRATLKEKKQKNKTQQQEIFKGSLVKQQQTVNEEQVEGPRPTLITKVREVIDIASNRSQLLHPDSTFKEIWDICSFVVIAYYITIYPLRWAVHLPLRLYGLDYIFDALSILDCLLSCFVFHAFDGGHLLMEQTEITQHYVKTRFWLDLLIFFPYDFFALIWPVRTVPGAHRIARIALRTPKLLLFSRVSRYYSQLERFLLSRQVNNVIFRMSELICTILFFAIWVACGWAMFAQYLNAESCRGDESSLVSEDDTRMSISCLYHRTWVQQQVETDKLPSDGGDDWSRFLRAINWALPTLTSETIGDTNAVNEYESLFAFFVMFCGLSINGAVIGNVMNLVSDATEEISLLQRNVDEVYQYLTKSNRSIINSNMDSSANKKDNKKVATIIPEDLIRSTIGFCEFLATPEGLLLGHQDELFAKLPWSLQREINWHVKAQPILRRCPLFDFCSDEVLINLSTRLQLQLYTKGNKIVNFGELGHEMFFIHHGKVDITGDDGTLYSTLEDGAFFGETSLFFRTTRTATIIVSSSLCICYVLSKTDLEDELRVSEYDEDTVLEAFSKLQRSNQRRNAATAANLKLAANKDSKLYKLIDLQGIVVSKASLSHRIRSYLTPECTFRMFWDTIGLILLLYYIFSIPLFIAFFFGPKNEIYRSSIGFEILIQLYWLSDILLKSFFFSYRLDNLSQKLIIDGESVWNHYYQSKHGYFWQDILSTIPVEFIILLKMSSDNYLIIYLFRASHLIRSLQLNQYALLVEGHISRLFKSKFRRSLLNMVKAGVAYIILNHWLACGYFMIHRYAEAKVPITYVIADGLAEYDESTGRHNICNTRTTHCYSRSIYFVLGTMTSIGYGDISPYTNSEIVYQQAISIIGALIAAVFLGFCGAYQLDVDSNNDHTFHQKLSIIEHYCQYRTLPQSVRSSIIHQYEYIWKKMKTTEGERHGLLHNLPNPTVLDIQTILYQPLFLSSPLLNDCTKQFKRRISGVLYPQVALASSYLYQAGDVGRCIYFISSGTIQLSLTTDETNVDGCGYVALNVLFHKQLQRGPHLYRGNNFGEMCLLSQTGLRVESAFTVTNCEVYYVVKEDLAEVFRYIEPKYKQDFLFNLAASCQCVKDSTVGNDVVMMNIPVISAAEVDDVELSWNGRDSALEELMHGYGAIVESISSALEGKVVKLDSAISPTQSTTTMTATTMEHAALTQVQSLLAIASVNRRTTSLDDAMGVNRKMRHSFSVESILNRKRNHATDANSDEDEDEESSIVTSRRSEVVFSDGEEVDFDGSFKADDEVRSFHEDESIKTENNENSNNYQSKTLNDDSVVLAARRYTISVITNQLLKTVNSTTVNDGKSLTIKPTADLCKWFPVQPVSDTKTNPIQRRASF